MRTTTPSLPLLLIANADNHSLTYGAANPPLTGTLTGVQNGDPITALFQTAADTNSPVGAHPITTIREDAARVLGNYIVTYLDGTLSVTPASLIVSADNEGRVYGGTNPVF